MEAKNKETTHSPEPAEKTICLVQLTRFGDLIQTMQVAKKLKTSRKDIRVTLVARKRFADPLRFLLEDVFDEIFTFDYNLLTNSESSTLDGTLENIDSFLNKVSEKPISALVNLSFSKPSGYLSTLIKAEFKIGVHYDNNSNLIVDDNWSQFVYSNVLGNNLNPFNLIDLYSNIIGVEKESDLPLAKKGTQKRILIHPFASLSRKRWKISKWSELVYKLLKDDPEVTVNIAGGKEDVSDVDVLLKNPILKEFSPRIKNHVGTKSIENIYDLLDNIDLFIGHDSMVGHLASLKQVQTITVSLGSVRPGETTPYQAGAYVLSPRTKCFPCQPTEKCELFQCHSDISYQVAYSVVEQIIRNGEIDMSVLSKNISSFHLSSVNIHRACFS